MDPSSFHSRICSMVLQNHETNIDGLGCDLMFQCFRTWNDSRWWIILSPVSGVGPKTWDKKHMTAGKLRFEIRWFMMFPMKLDWQVPQSIVHTEVVCSFEVGRSHFEECSSKCEMQPKFWCKWAGDMNTQENHLLNSHMFGRSPFANHVIPNWGEQTLLVGGKVVKLYS